MGNLRFADFLASLSSKEYIPPDMARKISKSLDRAWGRDGKAYWEAATTVDQIAPGVYTCEMSHQVGLVLATRDTKYDSLIEFPDPQTQRLYGEFKKFWGLGKIYKHKGFLHKRGYLLWGPPGSGKSSLVNLYSQYLIQQLNGVVLDACSNILHVQGCLQMLRRREPERPVMVLMEDLDALTERNEQAYLAVLDGSSQVDHVAFVATTNYPERLDKRFTNRPNRFDRVEKVEMPCFAQRHHYLAIKAPQLGKEVLRDWAMKSRGLSIAHLRELIVNVQCLGLDFNDSVARLHEMNQSNPSSHGDSRSIGILASRDEDEDEEDYYTYEPAAKVS